jgi:hypothetical protein
MITTQGDLTRKHVYQCVRTAATVVGITPPAAGVGTKNSPSRTGIRRMEQSATYSASCVRAALCLKAQSVLTLKCTVVLNAAVSEHQQDS